MAGRKLTREGLAKLETPEGADELVALAEQGLGIDAIAKAMRIPRGSITMWLKEGNHGSLFARAREAAADHLAVEALEIADELDRSAPGEVARDRLRVDTRKWLASKWNAAQYGEAKQGLNVNLNLGDLHLQAVKAVKPVYEHDVGGPDNAALPPSGDDSASEPPGAGGC